MTKSISSFIPTIGANVPTSVPNVFAAKNAAHLAEAFLSCDHAAQLLASERFVKPLLLDIQEIVTPKTFIEMDHHNNAIGAKIVIPEQHLQTDDALHSLALEIFNAQRTASGLYEQTRLGNVGMDSYANQLEEQESRDTRERFALIKQCANQWSISPEALADFTRDVDLPLEVDLFNEEIWCHTDGYRKEWIRDYQQIYCEKHPADIRSCEAKAEDLCDNAMVLSLPKLERTEFIRKRVCKRFPEAHEKVKNDPDYRARIRKWCPQMLAKASKQPTKKEL